MTFNLVSPLTIAAGSFVVGVVDEFAVSALDENENSTFPALMDVPGRSDPQGSESFLTQDGGNTWFRLSDLGITGPAPCDGPGSFLIRATVEADPADVLSATKISDPLAVEPWGVAISENGTEAFVTNLVSDNLTIVTTSDNSIRNIPVGDGPGGTPDGPFGVVGHPDGSRIYVTLFGSNTIPSKEFPVDVEELGSGKVAVFNRQPDGSYSPAVTIEVGSGPMSPAILPNGSKLYVPCNGPTPQVDVVDTRTNQRIATVSVPAGPTSCTVSLDGSKVYVTHFGAGSITVIDTRTDQKIKDIQIPQSSNPEIPAAENSWNAAISNANGALYAGFWGTTVAGRAPNGGVGVVDTCHDEFLRILADDSTQATALASSGASGIAAPTSPLTRDPVSGTTPGSGGGGGGVFGVAACQAAPIVFTNDGLGIVGILDSRIDQVVSAPPLTVASCPKPRGVACAQIDGRHLAFVACGQPETSILVVNIPALRENIGNVPVVDSVLLLGSKLVISGSQFSPFSVVELVGISTADGTSCMGFRKKAKVKKGGTRIIQKGKLTDGRSLNEAISSGSRVFVRLSSPDGEVRVARCCAVP